ncbi:phosphatidate cytidylyltransferase [Gilvimarinus sp. SDUM040013]|uniref:Phosphatidate cytidylyltransferase n=1 Tax=Gilvimarinus gilvus TaxID=3058038 RepID=A0ABU4S0G7_9GAMM|nr:phosphatidate cytidylyltransferase [Gilvimarinus sp. SDUM040013]MDO3385788.1 phosphatidate cytidylyltransferase [Gilvimarinus sp. SDUM040013]MDX6850650.1 phosphatidate cytidylyltransferase [Gilvimarinus sp. SDUM040013]
MLKQRVITAILLAAVFLGVLFFLPVALFPAFVATIVLISAWEWANLSGIGSWWGRAAYVVLQAVVIAVAAYYVGALPVDTTGALAEERYRNLLIIGCTWWAVALLWVQGYPSSALLWRHTAVRAVMGLFVLVPTWAAFSFVRLQEQGAWLVLMIVAVVAAADIGGYFVGRRLGRHKLAPSVSPGKTWEGFLGGVTANLCLALVIWLTTGQAILSIVALVIPTSLVSVLGDLLESMIKRERGIKDSSALLPGHGGVLDRVDSLTAAAPVFALALIVVDYTVG